MFLLLDECVARSLQATAEALGHTAQRSIDVASLGKGATDRDIFDFACCFGAVVVTINRTDFIALAARVRQRPGVILIPSLQIATLKPLFTAVLSAAQPLLSESDNLFVEIDAAGAITSFRAP